MRGGGEELDQLDQVNDQSAPAVDAPDVDFEPAEAEAGDDPTRVQRMHLSEPGSDDQGEDLGGEPGDVPGKMGREEFARMTVLIWSVPGMRDPRLKPLSVSGDQDREAGAIAAGRLVYDQIAKWAPFLIPPPIEGSGDMMQAGMFLWTQWQIFDQIRDQARAEEARDVSPEEAAA